MSTNDFDTALNTFVTRLQDHIDKYFAAHLPNLNPDQVDLEYGKKFVRVVLHKNSGGRSAHCFVVRVGGTTKALGTVQPGDILKPASWKAPAKHVRGTIFTDKFDEYGVSVYGANYLR